jgi:DNA-binding MarR family transcriptional regulator
VVSWPVTGEVESRVLGALAAAGTATTPQLTQELGLSTSTVHATLVRLVQAGLVHAEDGEVSLTAAGQARADAADRLPAQPVPNVMSVDLGEIGRAVSALWGSTTGTPSAAPSGAAPQPTAEDRRRGQLFASDADRDAAVHVLADALSVGRLTPAEFDERTNRALAARTYGDLDAVLQGLAGLPGKAPRSHPVRKALFWVVTVVSSPFVLLGTMLTAFGDKGDEIGIGIVLLVLTLPGLFGLWRWAWPRSSD